MSAALWTLGYFGIGYALGVLAAKVAYHHLDASLEFSVSLCAALTFLWLPILPAALLFGVVGGIMYLASWTCEKLL